MALGERIEQFERYNNTELRRMVLPGGFPFTVTGRLVSGGIGFVVIIIILAISFQSAANSEGGGSRRRCNRLRGGRGDQ